MNNLFLDKIHICVMQVEVSINKSLDFGRNSSSVEDKDMRYLFVNVFQKRKDMR